MCFLCISEQTTIISLHNINCLVFITETECLYCAVRTGSLYIFPANLSPFLNIESSKCCFPLQCTALITVPLLPSQRGFSGFTALLVQTAKRHLHRSPTVTNKSPVISQTCFHVSCVVQG